MNDKMIRGKILKCIGGLYSVETTDSIVKCKARGIFRKDGIKPLPGDDVMLSSDGEVYAIEKILERKNSLSRPPVANIDKLIIVSAAAFPSPSLSVIDRLTAAAQYRNIDPVVVFSKCDLGDVSEYTEIYRRAGFCSFAFSSVTGEGIERFSDMFKNSVCALTGNSGAGKSTLLNMIFPELELETGEISKKLGRGRHTTRCVELFPVSGGYIADTPGFSSFDIENGEFISKDELKLCFREFHEFEGLCKFTGCSHTVEKGCAVLEALQNGKIGSSRHASYVQMYSEVKDIPEWQIKKNR